LSGAGDDGFLAVTQIIIVSSSDHQEDWEALARHPKIENVVNNVAQIRSLKRDLRFDLLLGISSKERNAFSWPVASP
jgi:hypothetical protein